MKNKTKQQVKKNNSKAKKYTPSKDNQSRQYIVALAAAVIVFIVMSPALFNGFVYDDDVYISKNPYIYELSFKFIKAIFSNYYFGNYNPITITSYNFDYSLFGASPFGFHLVNLLLHSAVVFFLFFLIRKLTGECFIAFFVALLFGIHPLHVESAAWIAGRKDLLLGLFFVLSSIYYLKYKNDSNRIQFYIISFIFFIIACLSKAVAVMLPVVFLLYDFLENKKINWKSIYEKIPFFIVSLILGLVTIDAQKAEGSLKSIPANTLVDKILLFFYGLFFYIYKMFVPLGLSANYSAPPKTGDSIPAIVLITPIVIIGLVALALYLRKKSKILSFGCLFYFITILPVLQIVPVGNAFTADRFFYIPSIGLFFALAAGIHYLYSHLKNSEYLNRRLILTIITIIFLLLSFLSWQRTKIWKDEMTLFTDVIKTNPTFSLAYNNIGNVYNSQKNYPAAIEYLKKAIELNPTYTDPVYNLGNVYQLLGDNIHAIDMFQKTIVINPKHFEARHNLGISFQALKQYDSAMFYFKGIIAEKPDYVSAYNSLGVLYYQLKDLNKALEMFTETVMMNPRHADAFKNIGVIYLETGNREKAIENFRSSARLGDEVSQKWLRRNGLEWR
ncbi:MAG: repeat-containing protein YrrB [Ignavibacteria bacterium]|nr:repeat-containing protein YrrB [Ignavibacteria bacterium]